MFKNRQSMLKGQKGEKIAENYLRENSLKIIEKNFHSKYGEIDLIANHNGAIVFVEVKLRKKNGLVSAAESINPAKIKKIILTAQTYIQKHNITSDCRFDVVLITEIAGKYEIEWIKDAF